MEKGFFFCFQKGFTGYIVDLLVLNRVLVTIIFSVRGEFISEMIIKLFILIWVFLIDVKAFTLEWNKKLLTCVLKLLLLMESFKDFFLTLVSWSRCPIFG